MKYLHIRWTTSFDDQNIFAGAMSGDISQTSGNQQPRYSGLDFQEDPFKNSNYRYADPFAENSDPFGAPDSQVFGADPFNSTSDPFKSETADPFGSKTENNYENSKSLSSDAFGDTSNTNAFGPSSMDAFGTNSPTDAFGSKSQTDAFGASSSDAFGAPSKEDAFGSSDPFGSSFTANFSNAPAPNRDPFGSTSFNSNFGSSNDPFSLTNLKPASSTTESSSSSSAKTPTVGTTTNTVSYRKEKPSIESPGTLEKTKKKSSHSFSDFLTGSPLKLDKSDKKEKKEKKSGKFHLTSPLKSHKKESPSMDKKNQNAQSERDSEEVCRT